MPTLALEPRDAGTIDAEDLMVEFEQDLITTTSVPQACTSTCERTVVTTYPCVRTFA